MEIKCSECDRDLSFVDPGDIWIMFGRCFCIPCARDVERMAAIIAIARGQGVIADERRP